MNAWINTEMETLRELKVTVALPALTASSSSMGVCRDKLTPGTGLTIGTCGCHM